MEATKLAGILAEHAAWLKDLTKGERANLRGANLRGANLDFSCFPLWCGGTRFKAGDKLIMQVLAHLCSWEVSEEAKEELDKVREYAKKSHRAEECGIL